MGDVDPKKRGDDKVQGKLTASQISMFTTRALCQYTKVSGARQG